MKIAIWYHCLIRGPRIANEADALDIVLEQMGALQESRLSSSADQIHIGINGSASDALTVLSCVPRSAVAHLDEVGQTELSTLKALRDWLSPGWSVLYHHMKGAQHPPGSGFHHWRRRMEKICVWGWEPCVAELEKGCDTCGAHWFTHLNGALPGQRYWPGNFWWARSDYLLTLPPFPEDRYEHRYDAEDWIGKSPRPPRIKDFWPTMPMG